MCIAFLSLSLSLSPSLFLSLSLSLSFVCFIFKVQTSCVCCVGVYVCVLFCVCPMSFLSFPFFLMVNGVESPLPKSSTLSRYSPLERTSYQKTLLSYSLFKVFHFSFHMYLYPRPMSLQCAQYILTYIPFFYSL